MPWFKVDDMIADHPKLMLLGTDVVPAMGLWALVGTWAARYSTDGFVPDNIVKRYDPRRRLAGRLVEVGLWTRAEADPACGKPCGYLYHDWFDHQLTAEEVEKKRANNRERQKRHRRRSGRFGTDPGGPGSGAKIDDTAAEQVRVGGEVPHTASGNGVSHSGSNALHDALVTSTPTRPDPTRPSTRDLGGGAAVPDVGANAGASATPEAHDPPCEHPCRRCRDARLAGIEYDLAVERQRLADRAAHTALRDACPRCDEFGMVDTDPERPDAPVRRCSHGVGRPALRIVS